jgi:hypothetical protein
MRKATTVNIKHPDRGRFEPFTDAELVELWDAGSTADRSGSARPRRSATHVPRSFGGTP